MILHFLLSYEPTIGKFLQHGDNDGNDDSDDNNKEGDDNHKM